MRVKIGAQWHEVDPTSAIMIELTAADRANIANMVPDATKYAVFHDADERSVEQKRAWME